MRAAAAALLVAASISTAAAQQAPPRGPLLQENFGGREGFEVVTQYVDWRPGQSTGWHTHFGDEVAYVLEGELRIEIDGMPTRTVKAGEVYHNQMGQVHRTTNVSAAPARTLATYIVEKGKPRSTNAVAPPGYPPN